MSLAMALHFYGYEFARSATITLFTSNKTGFQNPSALPLALAFVFPTSATLLYCYTYLLNKVGAQSALRLSTLMCSALLSIGGVLVHLFSAPKLVNFVVATLYIFRESYVSLLSTQHWSFMGSILTPSQGSTWFAPIAGLSSIAAAIAGYSVGGIVDRGYGVLGLLVCAALSLVVSSMFGDLAYGVAEKWGFSRE
jgi:hypothetical protein